MIEGLRERILRCAQEKGVALPARLESMSNDQLVKIGHELTYPGSVNLQTFQLKV